MRYAQRIKPDSKVDLGDFDPSDHDGLDEDEAKAKTQKLGEELSDLQELMYAAGRHALLIVLQGRDTSGKDGTIRHLVRFINAQSCGVSSFKQPTDEELSHDFLWRVHAKTPSLGWAAIFNRSHYEDVLAVRVHDLVPKKVWKQRYAQINHFEELLHDADTLVLKFFLNISKDEQAERLMAREQDPQKSFKLSVGDWKERELWDDYTAAYEAMLGKCSTEHAPWFVAPANHKWFRDLAITEALVEALKPHKDAWNASLQLRGEKEIAALKAYRAAHGSKA